MEQGAAIMSAGIAPRWNGSSLAAILLDLDGTLLDTVDDITEALKRTLYRCGT
jgi:hypothetical protein